MKPAAIELFIGGASGYDVGRVVLTTDMRPRRNFSKLLDVVDSVANEDF